MISLKKYLDSAEHWDDAGEEEKKILPAAIDAYRSALVEMGSCGVDACPALGQDLKRTLANLGTGLSTECSPQALGVTESKVREKLQDWGRRAAHHYQQKADEVKDILLVIAHTAESVGERDQRCAQQIHEVTTRLKGIGNLDDLTQIRASIERSASDLKTSIDRMTEEGKAAIDQLRTEVSAYQTKLEEAEYIAACDSLTGLGSRLWVEGQIQRRIDAGSAFCAVVLDIDGFKRVNDEHGHLAGDDLLKQFSGELRSACRSTDTIGRWGGDEFIVLLDCTLQEATAQTHRVREWVCGNYTIQEKSGPFKLRVDASIGLAEHAADETMKCLLDRADAEMYQEKAVTRARKSRGER
jgi:diguanylate cyclase (GGDEF)-like protein